MIIIDTNVLSELMLLTPDAPVLRWWTEQLPGELFTTAINEAEIFAGIEAIPDGRRKNELRDAAVRIFETFDGRILSFDSAAGRAYGVIVAARARKGRPAANFDAQIAAIAYCHGAVVATRDVGGFEGCGVRVVDPWADATR